MVSALFSIMACADLVFHNYYLCQKLFSHAQVSSKYCNIQHANSIVRRGLLKLLQLKVAHENDLAFNKWTMNCAAKHGYLEIIKWLHTNRAEGCDDIAIDLAAKYGHLETVQWLHTNRTEGFTIYALRWAAEQGHLPVVKWLHPKCSSYTTYAMDLAAQNGHQEIVNWLQENTPT